MKPGTKSHGFLLILVLIPLFLVQDRVWGEEISFPSSSEERVARMQQVLLKESYFHFFIEDYLSAATRLRLIEDAAKAPYNEAVLNESRLLLGSLYLAWGMDRPATLIFNERVKVFPPGKERNDLLLFITRMQYERGLYQTALETYALFSAAEGFSEMDQAVYLAGMSHYGLGGIKEAVVHLKKIAPSSRYFPYAQLTLAQCYFLLEDVQNALQLFEAVSRFEAGENALLKSFQEKNRLIWGQALIEHGRYGKAYSVLAGIQKESPFYVDALFGMAWAQFKGNHYLKAILLFEDLVAFKPKHPYALEALTVIGHAYHRLRADQTALDRYSAALHIYAEAETTLRSFQDLVRDSDQLRILMELFPSGNETLLAGFLEEDDAVRYWVSQYENLSSLRAFLEQKIGDMEVFQVIVDHRDTVFRAFVPGIDRSLVDDPVTVLKKKNAALKAKIQRAVHQEDLSVLGTPEELQVSSELAQARARSTDLKLQLDSIETLGLDGGWVEGEALQNTWRETDRWLEILEGEWIWKISTELPGRADDREGALRHADADLSRMEMDYARLVLSVPAVEREIASFRDRIAAARTALRAQHEKTVALQEAVLPTIGMKLMQASDRRLNRLRQWASVAELTQIQILDLKSEMSAP